LQAFAGSAAPTGWLLCDGSLYTVALYPALYAVLGVAYGGVLGTSFNVPNLAGRVPVGAGTGAQQGASGSGVITGGTALTARGVGQFFGDERTELHTHTQNAHNHTQDPHAHAPNTGGNSFFVNVNSGGDVLNGGGSSYRFNFGSGIWTQTANQTATNQAQTATNQNTFAGTGANLQPSVVTNYIIKT
jgi:microcystin-dependent protein